MLRRQADERPQSVVYRFLADGEVEADRLTFRQLDEQARGIAVALSQVGAAGERVLLLFPPGLQFVCAFLGCLYAAALAVPAYPPRSRRGLPRLRSIVDDARPRVILGTGEALGRSRELLGSAAGTAPISWLDVAGLAASADAWQPPRIDGESLAFVQYTSGSTASPKGVMVSHANLLHNEEMIRRAFAQSAESVIVGWLPLYHDMGLIGNVLQPLYLGATCVLMSPVAFLQQPLRWLAAISRYRATTSGGPNFAYELAARKITAEQKAGLDLSSWSLAFNGAEPVRAETLESFAAAFAPCGFRGEAFYPCYGLAESTLFAAGGAPGDALRLRGVGAAALAMGRAEAPRAGEASRTLVACGRAQMEQRLEIVDPETSAQLPPGRTGEIWIAGPSVTGGYWGNGEATARDFHARLAGEPAAGPFLRTGDLGFVLDGELYVTGRLKDLIILRGRNLYPQDLELTAEQAHPALRPGCGAAFSVDATGEERLILVHELERRMDDAAAEEIAAAVRAAIAREHEAQVHEVVLIRTGTIPKTSSGKLQRHACRTAWQTGELAVVARSTVGAAEEAGGGEWGGAPVWATSREGLLALPAEERAAALDGWLRDRAARMLRVSPGHLDPGQPLVALGLDSLAAVGLQQELEERLGVAIQAAALLDAATLRGLRELVLADLGSGGAAGLGPPPASGAAAAPLTPAAPNAPDGDLPLSHGQRALWFLQRLAPGRTAYHIAAAARLGGAVDADALRRSFQALVCRHEALRTTYHDRLGEPVQRVRAAMEAGFAAAEAPGLAGDALTARLRSALYAPFDLENGPLLRAVLLRLGPEEHALGLAVHHLAADFWSLAVLVDELGRLYAREIARHVEPLPAVPLTYGEAVRAQLARLAGAEGERLWSWWHAALPAPPPDLDLPGDRPRPALQTERGGSCAIELGRELAAAVRVLAQANGATLFTALLASFQALLYRLTGQEQLAVGVPAAGRTSRELAGVVGYCVNPLVLRADVAGGLPFRDLLDQTRRRALGALAHQEYPFALLTERLQPGRDPSRSPLVQVMLVHHRSHLPEQRALGEFALGRAGARLQVGPLAISSLPLGARPAQLDLTLEVAATAEGLAAALVFNADLFDHATAQRLLIHWRTLLAGAAADASRALVDLPLLSPAEEAQLVSEWNATAADYPAQSTVDELIEEQSESTPDAVAMTAGDGSLTYRELLARAGRLASHLERLGVGPEVAVGVVSERTCDLAVGLLGVLRAGGAYVPIDPAYPTQRVAQMLDDSRAPVVVTQERLRPVLSGYAGRVVCLEEERSWLPQGAVGSRKRCGEPDSLAYVIYTSGSTGRPKGVQVTHRGVVNFLTSMARRPGLTAADTLVSVTTHSFDIFGLELYLPLVCGAHAVLASRETAMDGAALGRLLARCSATVMQATPATWRLLLAAGWDAPPIRALCGGEALPRELAERLLGRASALWNLYGPTETTIWSAAQAVERGPGPAVVPIGRPLANTGLYLLDAALRPVPVGVPGDLLIGGDGLARGYRGRPDLTAERFIPDPLGGGRGARLYRTGDLARFRPDGEIEFLGRVDQQVKIRGFRIELGEVEAALACHPAVRQAVVTAQPDAAGGHRLVAYWVAAVGGATAEAQPDAAALRQFLSRHLPDPCIPSLFARLDSLPLTPNGKIDRKALPAPGPAGAARGGVAPRSQLERSIAAVWSDVLRVGRVGVEDNFFDLGGHSLLAAQVHARLREVLQRDLSLVDLFRHPTVRALARFLAPEEAPALAAAPLPSPAAGPRAWREIAIIGRAGRFPGAPTVEDFWRRLRAGDELISFFSDDELAAAGVDAAALADPAFVRAGGVIEGAEMFDAPFFGLSPREAELIDPQHRIFLECAWHALEDAGYDSERFAGRIGLYAGVGINTYLHHAGIERVQALAGRYQAFIGNDKDFVATRVSYKLNLRGPSVNVQTACSTSLVGLHLACQALQAGDCEMALAGGVAVRWPQETGYLYEEGGIPSPDGRCRAFDLRAQGTVFGNGVGLVVLKPLQRALADGDTIHAVIKGTAINNDGARKVGYTAPSIEGQARVIAAALAVAGVAPETVGYVEAHGTGTPMGDPIEVAALADAFAACAPAGLSRRGFCALGSVKTNIGHLDTAAGIAGLIKTVEALKHRELPPSLHFETPNPRIDFAGGPFRVNARLSPWESAPGGAPRRAGVSSFGIGGTNAHAVLEEAPAAAPSGPSREWQLVALSARTAGALEVVTRELAAALRDRPELLLPDVAHTLRVGRRALAHRRLLVCRTREEAAAALAAADPASVWSATAEPGDRPVAFLLPGQGSQHAGMARGLYAGEPVFRRALDASAEALQAHLGLDLRALLFPPPAATEDAGRALARTELAQPALFAVEHALAQLWISWGVRPAAMLGHSLGEYVAACLAGVLSLADALALVSVRGRLMGALPAGAMLSVQVGERAIGPLLTGGLALAAVNGPDACAVAGPEGEVAALAAQLEREGIRQRRLHTSHAFHSAMMDPILEVFAAEVAKVALQPPRIPFLSNLTGTWITAAEATDPGYWVRHLRGTVRFADGVGALLAEPDQLLLEVGPGNALGTLARRSVPAGDRRLILASLPHPDEEKPDQAVALLALGRLWLAGAGVDWESFAAAERRRRVPLPLYPFERRPYCLAPRRPADAVADRLVKKAAVADWLYAPLWRQALPPAPLAAAANGGENEAPWLLVGSAEGPGARLLAGLAGLLERLGRRVSTAVAGAAGTPFARREEHRYAVDPGSRAGWDALVAALREDGRAPGRILHALNVTGVDAGECRGPDEALAGLPAARVRAFDSLVLLAQALDAAHAAEGVWIAVLSDGLQRVAGEAVLHPEKALLLGPVEVIPQEVHGLHLKSVDLSLPAGGSQLADLLEDLLAEAAAAPDPEAAVVAWRGGQRWLRTFRPARIDDAEGPLARVRDGGVYLITGGLGGIGLALAQELASLARVKLALLGRTALPPRGEWAAEVAANGHLPGGAADRIRRVQALESLGVEVLTLAADVADAAALGAAVRAAEEQLGPVRGVVHAAGLPGGRLLQLLDPDAADSVLAPKVRGTLALQAVLAGRPLDFFLLCSSINSVIGGFGQTDYCAASSFVDAFAQSASLRAGRRGAYVVSVGWDRWEEVGMAARSALPAAFWADGATPLHPLLDARIEATPLREIFRTEMAVERHWVLAEHRIAGHPTLPGTTYLEMARAAFAGRAAGRTVELRDVVFFSPLMVVEGQRREVLTTLEGGAEACEFQVTSRLGRDPWQVHARGRVAVASAPGVVRADLSALRGACSAGEVTARSRESGILATGPRWQSLRRLHVGPLGDLAAGQSLAELELDERFAGELEHYTLHPALLDVAAGAVQLLAAGDYLPLAYDRLVVHAPLSRKGFSHFRLRGEPREVLTCDITLLDETGAIRLEIEGFSMKRVGRETAERLRSAPEAAPPYARTAGEPGAEPGPRRSTGHGILPLEGRQVFRRLLRAGAVPHYVVSTRDLQAVAQAVDALDPTRLAAALQGTAAPATAHARPEVSSAYAPPADGLERDVAAVWERLLGVERVGVHDNFFELGGTSLSAIQLAAELKQQLAVEVPTVSIFQAPTVSALVRYLRPPAQGPSAFERTRRRAEKKQQVFAQTRRALVRGTG